MKLHSKVCNATQNLKNAYIYFIWQEKVDKAPVILELIFHSAEVNTMCNLKFCINQI